jgi:5'-deoxynucleotidase YfbR-like HD superfamily hydrolase
MELNLLALAGLHHDDTEAVTGDLPKPVKNACRDFRLLEYRLAAAVDERYGINVDHDIVKRADKIVFAAEVQKLVPPDAQWMYEDEVRDVPQKDIDRLAWGDLVPWPADEAYARYMDAHERYSK